MNIVKMCIAVMFGFLLACVILPIRPAKASGPVYVKKANLTGGTYATLGATVIGFSCAGTGDDIECYVATQ